MVVPLQQKISIYETLVLGECQFDREVCRQLCMIDGILKLFKSCELLYRGGGGLEIQLAWNINNGISEI